MSAPPFMPMYVGDYLSDTRHLTTEGHGAYLLLLMAMWRAGGKLPKEGVKLARIAGLTPAKWAKLEAEILAFFTVTGDAIEHRRIEKELEKYTKTCAVRAEAGARGGRAKALKTHETELAKATILPEQKATNQNQNQKEGKNKNRQPSEIIKPQQNVRDVRGSRLPANWNADGEAVIFAIREGFSDAEAFRMVEDFRDFWTAKTGAQATKLDWPATWRRWVREEAKRRVARRPMPTKRLGFV